MGDEAIEAERHQLEEILANQILLYTGGCSKSVPQDVVYDLLESVCSVLSVGGREPMGQVAVAADLAGCDLGRELAVRSGELMRRAKETRKIWQDVCIVMPPLRSIALRDTLAGIEGFWERYDPRLFAQKIPCDIDYPLCHPVSDALVGVDYVEAYLHRLRTVYCQALADKIGVMISTLSAFCVPTAFPTSEICQA
jgi:hypothetical protein